MSSSVVVPFQRRPVPGIKRARRVNEEVLLAGTARIEWAANCVRVFLVDDLPMSGIALRPEALADLRKVADFLEIVAAKIEADALPLSGEIA